MNEHYQDRLEQFGLADEDVPLVKNLDAVMLQKILENAKKKINGLDMSNWHGTIDGRDFDEDKNWDLIPDEKRAEEKHWCKTTHCRAGYAVCLGGLAGAKLDSRIGPGYAGDLIYLKSVGYSPSFYDSNQDALLHIMWKAQEQGLKLSEEDTQFLFKKYGVELYHRKEFKEAVEAGEYD